MTRRDIYVQTNWIQAENPATESEKIKPVNPQKPFMAGFVSAMTGFNS